MNTRSNVNAVTRSIAWDRGMKSTMQQTMLALMGMSALALAGCAPLDMPSKMTERPIMLASEDYSQTYKTAQVGAAQLDEIAQKFRLSGNGQAEVIVAYDPYSKKNTAMKASDQLHRITGELAKRRMNNVKGSILAVDYSGDESEMIVGYSSVSAQAPEGCGLMPGSDVMRVELDPDYKLGCSVKTMVARQVARPADLAGRSPDMSGGDGRRGAAVVETYRSGEAYESLDTYTTQ